MGTGVVVHKQGDFPGGGSPYVLGLRMDTPNSQAIARLVRLSGVASARSCARGRTSSGSRAMSCEVVVATSLYPRRRPISARSTPSRRASVLAMARNEVRRPVDNMSHSRQASGHTAKSWATEASGVLLASCGLKRSKRSRGAMISL